MMDDSMEISSEHGHRDEDIDIDIDLTAGHVDEDYVLEDAVSYATFVDNFHFQPYSVAGNDDLMVDEEDESYRMNEIDTDLVANVGSQSMANETSTTSFTATDVPTSYLDEREDPDHFEDALTKEPEVTGEQKNATSAATTEVDVQNIEVPASHEDESYLNKVNTTETEVSPADDANKESRPATPSDHSPRATSIEHPKSPSDSLPQSANDSPNHPASKNNLDTSTSDEHGEVLYESQDPHPTDGSNAVPVIPEILVFYQNTEYALFSTSESDDPDSFFLSDLSIIDAPVANFLKAIRDVIHEDLADEDELCLSMGDLGIEVAEVSCLPPFVLKPQLTLSGQTSTSIQEITLKQILNLYERLLRNDGIESTRPFCIQFGIRPNFSKRLANLAAGAAEGKGLSELIPWIEHSNTPEVAAEATENNDGDEANTETREGEDFDETETYHGDGLDSSDISQAQVSNTDLKSGHKPSDTASDLNSSSSHDNCGSQKHTDSATQPSLKVETSQNISGSSNDDYNEDDLIDYSDEEAQVTEKVETNAPSQANMLETESGGAYDGNSDNFLSPCFGPNMCFCSKVNDLLAEYETTNEELWRRSASREADDSLLEQSAEQTEVVEDEDEGEVAETIENGAEYDDDNDEAYYAETEVHEHDLKLSNSDDAVSKVEQEGNTLLSESQAEAISNGKSQDIESAHQDLKEIEYQEDQDTNAQDFPKLSDEDLGLDASPKKPLGDEHAGGLGFGDKVPSESDTSDKTLVALPETDEAAEDEIDYDEDDEQDAPEAQDPVSSTKELPAPLDGSGKRQREEANLDEGMSTNSKGVCYSSNLRISC
jgi:hypothetical protein